VPYPGSRGETQTSALLRNRIATAPARAMCRDRIGEHPQPRRRTKARRALSVT